MMSLTPENVVAEIAAALPEDCRCSVIIIGSLAAGFYFFADDHERSLRTKDADCMFAPHAKAVAAAKHVTERLFTEHWQPKEGRWGEPGDEHTPEKDLPMIRLKPPASAHSRGSDWFLELLGAPDKADSQVKRFYRIETSKGHYAICSFSYLALAEWHPLETNYGLRIARPEMMALANMLHHTEIRPEPIDGSQDKRSNKDLGRVLALYWLAGRKDIRDGTNESDRWAERMIDALQNRFSSQANVLALQAGLGIRALMASQADLKQALDICNRGLLSSLEVNLDAYVATGLRFIQNIIEPLDNFGRDGIEST